MVVPTWAALAGLFLSHDVFVALAAGGCVMGVLVIARRLSRSEGSVLSVRRFDTLRIPSGRQDPRPLTPWKHTTPRDVTAVLEQN